jgi:hypothetical protein
MTTQLLKAICTLLGAGTAVAGLILLCIGIYGLGKEPILRNRILYYRRRWNLDASVDDITLSAAVRVLGRINAWSLIFAGPGITLVSIIWLCIGWSEGSFLFAGIFSSSTLVILFGITFGVLECVGRAYGIHRMRTMARNHPAYGDLLPRRVRDYVPSWVGVAVALWILVLVILTVMALFFANVPLRISVNINQWIYIPPGRWGLLAIPLVVVLFLALGLGLLRWMVALPRLKSLDELPDVGVFDVHFRRESIYSILNQYSNLVFWFFMIQWFLVLDNVPRLPVPAFILWATLIANGIVCLAIIIGLLTGRAVGPSRRSSAPVAQ